MQLRCLCKYAYDCDVWVVLLPALVYIVAARCLHTYVAALFITVRPKYLIHLGQWINEAHWIYLQAMLRPARVSIERNNSRPYYSSCSNWYSGFAAADWCCWLVVNISQGRRWLLKTGGGALCVEMGFYTDISWESRCNIEINVRACFYKILLVFEVPYRTQVKGMPQTSFYGSHIHEIVSVKQIDLGSARTLKKYWNFIKMSSKFNFTVTSFAPLPPFTYAPGLKVPTRIQS